MHNGGNLGLKFDRAGIYWISGDVLQDMVDAINWNRICLPLNSTGIIELNPDKTGTLLKCREVDIVACDENGNQFTLTVLGVIKTAN